MGGWCCSGPTASTFALPGPAVVVAVEMSSAQTDRGFQSPSAPSLCPTGLVTMATASLFPGCSSVECRRPLGQAEGPTDPQIVLWSEGRRRLGAGPRSGVRAARYQQVPMDEGFHALSLPFFRSKSNGLSRTTSCSSQSGSTDDDTTTSTRRSLTCTPGSPNPSSHLGLLGPAAGLFRSLVGDSGLCCTGLLLVVSAPTT